MRGAQARLTANDSPMPDGAWRVADEVGNVARPPRPGRGPDPLPGQPLRDPVRRPAVDDVPEDQRDVLTPFLGRYEAAVVLVPLGREPERDASDELPGFLQRGQFPGHLLYDVLTFLVSTLGSDPQRVPSRLSGHRKRSLMTYSFLRLVSAHLRSQARS